MFVLEPSAQSLRKEQQMRLNEFDFRVWIPTHKIYAKKVYFECFNGADKNEIEVEPWSGFYDKNGKKIYENDILLDNQGDRYHLR